MSGKKLAEIERTGKKIQEGGKIVLNLIKKLGYTKTSGEIKSISKTSGSSFFDRAKTEKELKKEVRKLVALRETFKGGAKEEKLKEEIEVYKKGVDVMIEIEEAVFNRLKEKANTFYALDIKEKVLQTISNSELEIKKKKGLPIEAETLRRLLLPTSTSPPEDLHLHLNDYYDGKLSTVELAQVLLQQESVPKPPPEDIWKGDISMAARKKKKEVEDKKNHLLFSEAISQSLKETTPTHSKPDPDNLLVVGEERDSRDSRD
ncbi:hypothetical protein NEHOM01_2535, partial [Nematocida homosporus]|uniref:uncharacterized protein n=1 Tax=Nematocida homosporus TaxID=1912981 RepID=UPI002220EDFA